MNGNPPGRGQRLLITGGTGLLGNACVTVALRRGFTVSTTVHRRAPTRGDVRWLDADFRHPERMLEEVDSVIHTAANPTIAGCEQDKEGAWATNVDLAVGLARACAAAGKRFIHLSTDLVFPGTGRVPLTEDMPTAPVSHYGRTKEAAERGVLEAHPNALVVRTSLMLGPSPAGDRGVDELVRKAVQSGAGSRLFVDEFRTPSTALDVAETLVALVHHPARGILHVAGDQHFSRLELGQLICRVLGLDAAGLIPSRVADMPMVPPRAPDTRLSTARLRQLVPPVPAPVDLEAALRRAWESV